MFGMQILMDAALAVQMGVPIYAVVALTNTATDGEGRSVPAPGQGILTTAREARRTFESPVLKVGRRLAAAMHLLVHPYASLCILCTSICIPTHQYASLCTFPYAPPYASGG